MYEKSKPQNTKKTCVMSKFIYKYENKCC